MRPGNPTYLMWVGDIVELANTFWGSGSAQTLRLAGALHGAGAVGTGDRAVTGYLERLRTLDEILADLEEDLGRPG
ncbi:MAG TPA: hypothetical protein VK821_20835 [Dehalococcoidia bacterium]|nr:hypothetical protein [Dehalococcoidia bacterium]